MGDPVLKKQHMGIMLLELAIMEFESSNPVCLVTAVATALQLQIDCYEQDWPQSIKEKIVPLLN
jgi:hypothetical protein